ncbi:hypothetical protein F52700_2359 [Fusarium sp. NRRL 52700]|nr:hypothetical protein F52700_2359 [Fusarium sp. NRRL 52700]
MHPMADKLMRNVGNKNIVVQSFAYVTGQYEKLGLRKEDKPVEEMQRLRDEASKILSPELANLTGSVRSWEASRRVESESHYGEHLVNGRKFDTSISSLWKLISTQIGDSLGWGRKRMRSGVYPAEWLHLSAFSWGGVASVDDEDGYITSQNLENLVFGTSEWNSAMTRRRGAKRLGYGSGAV